MIIGSHNLKLWTPGLMTLCVPATFRYEFCSRWSRVTKYIFCVNSMWPVIVLWVHNMCTRYDWPPCEMFLWKKIPSNYSSPICITMTSQWPRRRLKSPVSRLFTQSFRGQIKENINAPRHWPLCAELTGEFPAHKGPVTREMFPFDDVIMWSPLWIRQPQITQL